MGHAAVLIGLALAWEFGAQQGWVSALLFPPPSTILVWLGESVWSGEMLEHLAASGGRLIIGVAIGAGLGTVAGLSMGLQPRLRAALDPVIAAIHPLPKVAMLPLFLVILGFGEPARLLPIAMVAFFPMAIAGTTAVRGIDPLLWDVAHNYGAGPWMLMRRVVLPGTRPMLLAGFRLSLNAAVIVMVSVEMLTGTDGLGAAIWQSWQTMRVEQLYGTLVVVALLGILVNKALGR